METFALRFSLVLLLSIIGFQDLKYRGISWYLFPALVGLLVYSSPRFEPVWAGTNAGFIGLVLVFLTLWFSLREGRLVNLFSTHLGIGDVLFLLCLGCYFSPVNFFLFYVFSLTGIALGSWIYRSFFTTGEFTVPLAGLQGAMLMACLLMGWSEGIDIADLDFLTHMPWM